MRPARNLRRKPAAALGAVVGFALLLAAAPAAPAQGGKQPPRPNIVLFMTDDQSAGTVRPDAMPNLFDLIINRGSSFEDYVVTTPLCCPSRATNLTGQYGHNNGVLRNDYAGLRSKRNVLPSWLRRVGYRTAHVGKFLNGYERSAKTPQQVAPGWDRWFTQLEPRRYYNWRASKNGKVLRFGAADGDHLTEVANRQARSWARQLAGRRKPFFLQYDFFAPHAGQGRDGSCPAAPVPAPRDAGRFADEPLPQPPSFNEEDVSDKPLFIRQRPLMDAETIERTTRLYRCTLESLRGADRGIRMVHRQIERAGQLRRTVFIFTSDNGFFFGEHRIPRGKAHPYEENLRMPLAIRTPPRYRGGPPLRPTIGETTANIDLAPTILELARAQPCNADGICRTLDGRSLMPLLDGRGGWPAGRSIVIELFDCSYRGIRARDEILLEHGSGAVPPSGECVPTETEHYDLAADPHQLDNLYPAPRRSPYAARQLELDRKLSELRECAGVAGRDPAPPSGNFCE